MYHFILFIIFPFLILPTAASKNDICLAKASYSIFLKFFHQVVVSNSVQRHVSNFAWWTAPSAYWKNMDFSAFSPLCYVRLQMPSSTHVLSIKELGHSASKFEQTNSHVEIVSPNSFQTLICPAVVYLCCLWAACGEEVYITWSERHQTKWPL